jgi:hypothetical protein
MPKSIILAVSYSRIPKTERYDSEIEVKLLTVAEYAGVVEETLIKGTRNGVHMDTIIADVHQLLHVHPEATVTMLQGTTRPTQYGQKPPRGFELDEKMRNLIKDDLHEAQKAFAPIERTIKVRPTPPKIAIKECDDERKKQTEF